MTVPAPINAFQAQAGDNNNITQVDGTVTTTAGHPLIVSVSLMDPDKTATVSGVVLDPAGNNEALTLEPGAVINNDAGTSRVRVEIWYLLNPTAGTNLTIRATASEGCHNIVIAGYQVQGADTTDVIGAVNTRADSGSGAVISVTTTAADSLVLGSIIWFNANTTATAGAGDTERWDIVGDGLSGRDSTNWGGDTPATTIGTYEVSATNDGGINQPWAGVGVEILAGSAGSEESDSFTADAVIHKAFIWEVFAGTTPDWVDIGANRLVFSGSGGIGETLKALEFQDETHIGDGTPGTDQCGANHPNNVKYISDTEMQVNGGSTENINDTNLAENECTVRIRFTHSTSVAVSNVRLYCYDGTTETDLAPYVDVYAFERGVSATQWTKINDASGVIGGENTGEFLSLAAHATPATEHIWYLAISVSPEVAGALSNLEFGIALEYV